MAGVPHSTITEPTIEHAAGKAVLRSRSGAMIPLLIDRWSSAPTAAELAVLDRAHGPVIDVGCGPGRHVIELAARGVMALGIDVSADAVAIATRAGSVALQRSVFERVPSEGGWRTALLFDGNIGIGGDAVCLLRRLREILRDDGAVLVEVEPPGAPTIVDTVRVERDGVAGPWFAWARASTDGIDQIADDAGFVRSWTHHEEGRWFAELSTPRRGGRVR